MFRRATLAFACIVVMLGLGSAEAADISLAQARQAAGKWLERNQRPLNADVGGTPVAGRTFTRADGAPLFHVVRLSEGGFIVTSAEDGIDPIIAVSDGDDLVVDDDNPLWVLLNKDMDNRRKSVELERAQAAANPMMALADLGEAGVSSEAQWADLLAESDFSILGLSSVTDVRVSPLVQSTWDQATAGNYSNWPITYNYYTPNNYVCGCVATAMAQLMRYHQFPTASMSPFTRTCYVDSVARSLTTMAGTYSWANMPLSPNSSITETQRQAIGKLTYDAGVSVGMQYTANSSGAFTLECASALTSVFKYSNGMAYDVGAFNSGIVQRSVLANLDGGYPVLLGIEGSPGGHAIVGDGYGYSSSTLYVHLNLGWSGSQNAWYNLPTVDTAYGTFTTLSTIIYNVYTSGTGELVTGRVVNDAGVGIAGAAVAAYKTQGGAFVTNTVTGANGIYALHVNYSASTRNLNIVATYNGASQTKSVTFVQSKTATYTRSGMSMSISYVGTVGNSWGNDFTFNLPATPTGVSATDGASTDNVTVTWGAATYATSYEVWRGTGSSSTYSTRIASGITATTYSDVTAAPGVTYYYWVKAVNAVGTSGFSSSNTGYRALLAPTGVMATDGTLTTGVDVTWNAVTGASYYCVSRSTTSAGTKTALMSTWQAGLSYTDTSAVGGVQYYYFVQAGRSTSGLNFSAYSAYDAGMRADEVAETSTTPVPVPYVWLDSFSLVSGSDYEAAGLGDSDGDGFDAWEEYVAGTEPTNDASFFRADLVMVNGVLVVEWTPDLGAERTYTVFGKTSLGDATWVTPTNAASRFFRVGIDMD